MSPSSPDPFEQLRQWSERIEAMPEPIAYIVLDPNWSPSLPCVDGHDAQGRRYVVFSPAVLDECEHRKWGGFDVAGHSIAPRLSAIPIYRREDMPEGWPDA